MSEDLREAAYWYRAMIRAGGPDGSELDYAIELDLDAALGDYEPDIHRDTHRTVDESAQSGPK